MTSSLFFFGLFSIAFISSIFTIYKVNRYYNIKSCDNDFECIDNPNTYFLDKFMYLFTKNDNQIEDETYIIEDIGDFDISQKNDNDILFDENKNNCKFKKNFEFMDISRTNFILMKKQALSRLISYENQNYAIIDQETIIYDIEELKNSPFYIDYSNNINIKDYSNFDYNNIIEHINDFSKEIAFKKSNSDVIIKNQKFMDLYENFYTNRTHSAFLVKNYIQRNLHYGECINLLEDFWENILYFILCLKIKA